MAVSLSHRCLMEFLQKSDSGVTVSHQPRVCCAVRQPPTRGQEPPVSPSCESVAARGRAEVCGTRVCARVCTCGLPAPLSVPASQPTFITGHSDISFISSILHIPRSEFLLLFFTKRQEYVFSPLSIAVFLRTRRFASQGWYRGQPARAWARAWARALQPRTGRTSVQGTISYLYNKQRRTRVGLFRLRRCCRGRQSFVTCMCLRKVRCVAAEHHRESRDALRSSSDKAGDTRSSLPLCYSAEFREQ